MYGSFADSKVFETLLILAGVGILALAGVGCYFMYWLCTHVTIGLA